MFSNYHVKKMAHSKKIIIKKCVKMFAIMKYSDEAHFSPHYTEKMSY